MVTATDSCGWWSCAQLEEVVNVHKKHVQALEKALRCLDNDALTSEELDPLKDDLEYYLVRHRAVGFYQLALRRTAEYCQWTMHCAVLQKY
jgi:hypothetical protein